ncbi:hypothetical protein Tco_1369068 [Tanacetum coccineum]
MLKAITDRIVEALPSDTVKNPKLSTSPVLSALSYPTIDQQCSTQIHSSINAIMIHPKQQSDSRDDRTEKNEEEGKESPENTNSDSSTPPDPSISFITKKVLKFNSLFESLGLVPPSPNAELVCTKEEDGDVMFIEIIPKDDNSHKEEPEAGVQEVEYFDIFLTRSELAYHKYLMCGPIPSIFLWNPINKEACPSNLKIPCNIRHVHVEKAYIDVNSPLNIMIRMMYNWIMRRKLDPRENSNRGVSNFTGRIKGMHLGRVKVSDNHSAPQPTPPTPPFQEVQVYYNSITSPKDHIPMRAKKWIRAATTATYLEAEQESGNIYKTRSTATLNEPSPQGTVQVVDLGAKIPHWVMQSQTRLDDIDDMVNKAIVNVEGDTVICLDGAVTLLLLELVSAKWHQLLTAGVIYLVLLEPRTEYLQQLLQLHFEDEDLTIAQTLVKMRSQMDKEKGKGVAFRAAQEESARSNKNSSQLLDQLEFVQLINPKIEGKGLSRT